MNRRILTGTLLALAVSCYFHFKYESDAKNQGPLDDEHRGTGFRERAVQAGIEFRMAFLPDEQGQQFKINLYDHGAGVAVGDYDGDGKDDIYFLNQLGSNALYRNNGNGTFTDVTKKAGVGLGDRVCVGATFADYDNDGDQDLYVTSTRGGNVLFRNEGNGTFVNVTAQVNLELIAHSQTAAFFDYNNDGFLDLIVTNTASWTLDEYDTAQRYFPGQADFFKMASSPRESNRFYRNNGGRSFTDVTKEVGLEGHGWSGDVAVFDFNRDGFQDLLVTHMFGASQLYRNNAGKNFTDVTRAMLGRTSWGAIGCKLLDINNDGLLDLFIVDMHSDMWVDSPRDPRSAYRRDDLLSKHSSLNGPVHERDARTKQYEQSLEDLFRFRSEDVVFGNTCFKQLPSGKFEEVSDSANLESFWPWGVASGDFDNDGFEDLYVPSGMGFPFYYWPSSLLMNNGNETFTDRAEEAGVEPPPEGEILAERIGGREAARSSRCAAVGDFDGDGRLDLVVNNFNDRPYFFINRFPQKSYIAFRLKGVTCNTDAIGAVVTLHFPNGELMTRQVQAAGGYLSHSSKTLHFGLGSRTAIERVEIRWPDGKSQLLRAPDVNTIHRVTQL